MDHIFQITLGRQQPTESPPALPAEASSMALTGRLYLLIAPPPALDRLMDLLAVRLALAAEQHSLTPARQPYLRILDGGNRFDLHAIARGLNASASQSSAGNPKFISGQPPAILQRIQVARAFTCYQMEALLAAACSTGAASRPAPVLALRLLATFADGPLNDGAAPPGERLRLLARCIQHLKCLANDAPVLVSAAPSPAATIQAALLRRLESAADQVWRFETHDPAGTGRNAPTQLRLFDDRPSNVPRNSFRTA